MLRVGADLPVGPIAGGVAMPQTEPVAPPDEPQVEPAPVPEKPSQGLDLPGSLFTDRVLKTENANEVLQPV